MEHPDQRVDVRHWGRIQIQYHVFDKMLHNKDIHIYQSMPHTPQQNGRARRHIHLKS